MKTFSTAVIVAVGALTGAAIAAWCLWTAFQSNLLDLLMLPVFVWLVPVAAVAGGATVLRALRSEDKVKWTRICVLSVALPVVFVVWASRLDLDDSLCENQTVQSARSPDGKTIALAFTRDCGAVGSNNTMVVGYPKADGFPKNPNRWDKYIAYNGDEDSELQLQWHGLRQLTIERSPDDGPPYFARRLCNGIAVSYDAGAIGK